MSLRQRLLIMFAAVVILAVAAVSWIVSTRARRSFEEVDRQRTVALVSQFRREFELEAAGVSTDIDRLVASERVQRIAFESANGGDSTGYVREASVLANEHKLDFLDFISKNGVIISSAEWPARFGYTISTFPDEGAALGWAETADGKVPGLIATKVVKVGDAEMVFTGGKRLDKKLLEGLSIPAGTYLWLYVNDGPEIDAKNLLAVREPLAIDLLKPLIIAAKEGRETSAVVALSADRFDGATIQAVPLTNQRGVVTAVILVGTSRRTLLELEQNIRSTGFAVAGIAILAAIIAALWISAKFTRPIEALAAASKEVASGNWDAHVAVSSRDEVGQLAEAFNTMTRELGEHRDRLVQAERVAAWRELARRLAHELKNPLFPLQITVENLIRAREMNSSEFEEIFKESTATLLGELSNLKTIIGRFSDFSKMPKPQLQSTSVNEVIQKVASLHEAQIASNPKSMQLNVTLDDRIPMISADPELLHRVISNLVLNAIDAMPEGGTISLRTKHEAQHVRIEVADTGAGLTSEERERLFTPYYTTKQHGTGLGLAVVQSVISDHGGAISVESNEGRGTTFIIHLPVSATGSISDAGRATA